MGRVPTQGTLPTQNIARTEGVAAVQGYGVIQHMQNTHGLFSHAATTNWSSRTVAWNISSVQRGALWSRMPDWCSSTRRAR